MGIGFLTLHSAAEWIILIASLIAILFIAETFEHMAWIQVVAWTGLSISALIHHDVFLAVVWFALGLVSGAAFLIDWGHLYRRTVAAVRPSSEEDAA